VDFTGATFGMAVTGLIPVVAIGSVIGLLVAVRDERRDRVVGFGLLLAISLAATAWIYVFVLR
jgi:ABC-type dipeptide/oligopeptide/nickel transport system permease component